LLELEEEIVLFGTARFALATLSLLVARLLMGCNFVDSAAAAVLLAIDLLSLAVALATDIALEAFTIAGCAAWRDCFRMSTFEAACFLPAIEDVEVDEEVVVAKATMEGCC
jgi:hypothetical protein